MPPPGSSSRQGASATPSPTDNPPSSSRLSKDSEGYPSWLPKRPPPPAPTSTFQSSILGGLHGSTPSPVEPTPFVGGRKPTPRSVRIVNLQDSFVGAVEKDGPIGREPTDQTQVGVNVPPKVWTRASGVPPTTFSASEHDELAPLPQPRFNAKNLHLQILDHPSKWMRMYYFLWPLIVFYHIPLQTFFDFNAVFVLFQVAKYPNPQTSGKNWALGAAAYVACWLAWIFVVCVVYELIYSFSRRWRLRRPLMLPIYLSSPAFNIAALTSYTNFSFLQHLRYSAFFPEQTSAINPQLSPDTDYDPDDFYDPNERSWKQGLAETFFFYSQNLPTVALLLPRAGLSLALLFAFSNPPANFAFVNAGAISRRDGTFFRDDGALTGYARGVLIANAAWTAWKVLILLISWIGLWLSSNQRLGGICGPRHRWEESEQEKTRSVYSEAASEYGAYRGSFYHPGEGSTEYGGDELPWEWRESTRMRVQDSFEFCLTTRKSRSDSSAGVLRWSTASGVPVVGNAYGQRSRRHRNRHHKRKSSSKGKEPSSAANEKADELDGDQDEPFEGLERVLAAVGFSTPASPSRRGILHRDLFAAPPSTSEAATSSHHPVIEPLQFQQTQPTASTSMFTGLEAPKMAKRNSKDKIPGSSTGTAPLLTLPYPFSRPGAGHVSSKDSVPFPGARNSRSSKSSGSRSGKNLKSGSSDTGSGDSGGGGSGSGSGSGSAEGEEDEGEDDEDDDDDEDEDDEDDIDDSEEPSSERASGSMSSLGHPINSPSRYPFGMRRAGHGRSASGVSSGMSSGPAVSGGSHAHSQSMSSSYGTGAVSVITHSTGNRETTDSEAAAESRERANLSQGSSNGEQGSGIPMPPRHPRAHGQGRGRTSTGASSSSAAAAMAALSMHSAPVAFPTIQPMRRVDSGRGVVVHPILLYGEGFGSDMEGQHELHDDDEDEDEDEEDSEDEVRGEREDRVGLLGVPSSLHGSRVSLANTSSSSGQSGEARSRTHSAFSGSSRSRHSSTRARSRSRAHSSHSPSVRERANSLGASMRSLMQGASASLTQLDLVMRGATGPAAGLGGLVSRPRSRVNSSMARLEEDVVFSPSATEMGERNRGVSGGSSGSGSGDGVSPLAGRTHLEEAEGYVSSGGTHSRSGSESVSAENYTFGRPILFMRPAVEQQHESVEEEDEVVVMERSTGTAGRGSPSGSASVSIPTVMRVDEHVSRLSDPLSASLSTTSFYSLEASDRTASPTTLVPGPSVERPPSAPHSVDHSPTRQGVDIPWNQRSLLVPPDHRSRWGAQQPHDGATTGSGSPPDISTAAGSFVTATATIEDNMTATDSAGQRTVPSSWGTIAAAAGPALRSGGMVERPGEDMGAGGAGRIM